MSAAQPGRCATARYSSPGEAATYQCVTAASASERRRASILPSKSGRRWPPNGTVDVPYSNGKGHFLCPPSDRGVTWSTRRCELTMGARKYQRVPWCEHGADARLNRNVWYATANAENKTPLTGRLLLTELQRYSCRPDFRQVRLRRPLDPQQQHLGGWALRVACDAVS